MADVDFTLKITCMSCPLSAEGMVGDKTWFFRARHGNWWLEIDDKVVNAGMYNEEDEAFLNMIPLLYKLIYRAADDRITAYEDASYRNFHG
jgi:hypothetical protein